MSFKITKTERTNRVAYILLGFFTFYLVDPIQTWVNGNLPVHPVILGAVGILAVLYFFKF